MRQIKIVVLLSTLKMLYMATVQPYFYYCSPLYGIIAELERKIGCEIGLLE